MQWHTTRRFNRDRALVFRDLGTSCGCVRLRIRESEAAKPLRVSHSRVPQRHYPPRLSHTIVYGDFVADGKSPPADCSKGSPERVFRINACRGASKGLNLSVADSNEGTQGGDGFDNTQNHGVRLRSEVTRGRQKKAFHRSLLIKPVRGTQSHPGWWYRTAPADLPGTHGRDRFGPVATGLILFC